MLVIYGWSDNERIFSSHFAPTHSSDTKINIFFLAKSLCARKILACVLKRENQPSSHVCMDQSKITSCVSMCVRKHLCMFPLFVVDFHFKMWLSHNVYEMKNTWGDLKKDFFSTAECCVCVCCCICAWHVYVRRICSRLLFLHWFISLSLLLLLLLLCYIQNHQ